MVAVNRDRELNELLTSLAGELDVPQEAYSVAERLYGQVGNWLVAPTSPLAAVAGDVYVQGSFRIGTAIRPLAEGDEYDVDLVAPLRLAKETISKEELKARIGQRLRSHPEFGERRLAEKRRCWTITFDGGFHMDILPALLKRTGGTSLWIADREQRLWLTSDPIAFGSWFTDAAGRVFAEERGRIAMESRAEVQSIPAWRVRSPLQRVVQMLKRHRDLHFQDGQRAEFRPASIILTVLAGRTYGGETDTWEAFRAVVESLDAHVAPREGRYAILNPTNPAENFADRWNEDERLPTAFFAWTHKLREDVTKLRESSGIDRLGQVLAEGFGAGAAKRAIGRMSGDLRTARDQGQLRAAGGSLVVGGAAGRVVSGHTFYGTA